MANLNHLGQQFHEMTQSEFAQQPGTWFHGAANGMIGAHGGAFHVGTFRAAHEALGARMAGKNPGNYPKAYDQAIDTARRTGQTGSKRPGAYPSDPKITPGRIVGKMSNNTFQPYRDEVANGMAGRLRHQGVYYKNIAEDSGSVSAVLPNREHFKTHEDFLVDARAAGKSIPKRALKGYKVPPGQGKLF